MGLTTKAIWEDFRCSLRGFILKRVQGEQDAEDILQDVFCKIHNKIGTLKDERTLRTWIYRITRNSIIDYYRFRKSTVDLTDTIQKVEDEPPSDISAEISSCVKLMIDGLPDKYRQALDLTEFKGLKQKEMAETLGLSLSGAKSRVQRARVRLKEKLLDCCHFEFDRRGNLLDYQPKNGACSCSVANPSC